MSSPTEATHFDRSSLSLIPIQNVFLVHESFHMRKRASSNEHYRDLEKVQNATPKLPVDIRIMLKFSRDSFHPSRRAEILTYGHNMKFAPLNDPPLRALI